MGAASEVEQAGDHGMKTWQLFAGGVAVGIALTATAIVSNWIPWSETLMPQTWYEAEYALRARAIRPEFDLWPYVDIYHGVALDPVGALDVGTTRENEQGVRFACEPIETKGDVRAFHVWRSNGVTGDAAVFRFGPGPEDVDLRVYSFGDHGQRETTWDYPHASIRLSDWPLDRPGTVVAFEIEGRRDSEERAFDGKFRVPGTR